MKDLPLVDFHCHAGDVSRTDEIAQYIVSENLSGLVLLSLSLSGSPGYSGTKANFNSEVLEIKRRLTKGDPDRNYYYAGSSTDSLPSVSSRDCRVFTFGSLDNRRLLQRPGGSERLSSAEQVIALSEAGFDGLKLWEGKPELSASLGLLPDNPYLVEACREAGHLGMPVIFHVADPPEFWTDPGRKLNRKGIPDFYSLIDRALRLCCKVPETTIIFPHFAFLAGDLKRAGKFLEEAPNAYFDLAPGNYFYRDFTEKPDETRQFFSTWKNRILFGTDGFFFPLESGAELLFPGDSLKGNRKRLTRLKKFLERPSSESVDNVYPLSRDLFPRVPCLNLDREVLEAVFAGNAFGLPGFASGTGKDLS